MNDVQESSGLFDSVYHAVYEDVANYTAEAVSACLHYGGLDMQQGFTTEEAWAQLRCIPAYRQHVEWALAYLAQQGCLVNEHGYWTGMPHQTCSFGTDRNVHIQPSLDLIDYVAAHWLDIIQGNMTGLHVLFNAEGSRLWAEYFSNSHDLYAVHNQWAAECMADQMKASSGEPDVLELGVGSGSATQALLAECSLRAQAIHSYVLTDISASLAHKARRSLPPSLPVASLDSRKLNMDAVDSDIQQSFDYIYAVNVVHCAYDIVATLKQLRACLKPNGYLILSECMRADDRERLHQEFIFSLLPAFRPIRSQADHYPVFGFYSPADWRQFMEAAGFEQIRIKVNEGKQVLGGLVIGS